MSVTTHDISLLETSYKEKKSIMSLSSEPIWLRAFAEYNENNTPRLSMNCTPCYIKVLLYLKSKAV